MEGAQNAKEGKQQRAFWILVDFLTPLQVALVQEGRLQVVRNVEFSRQLLDGPSTCPSVPPGSLKAGDELGRHYSPNVRDVADSPPDAVT